MTYLENTNACLEVQQRTARETTHHRVAMQDTESQEMITLDDQLNELRPRTSKGRAYEVYGAFDDERGERARDRQASQSRPTLVFLQSIG